MIARIWKGWVERERAAEYRTHFREAVLPELLAVPNCLGAELLMRELGREVEFTVISNWVSIEAVKAFAGEDIETAVVHAPAAAALDRFEDRVEHHEVVERG